MKKQFSIFILLLFSVCVFAASNKKQEKTDLIFQIEDETETKKSSNGSFGLKMGMTLNDITKACGNMHTAFKKGHWSVEKGTSGGQKRTT